MESFSVTDLKGLLDVKTERCVSIYLPTHRLGLETQQDPIRLKNLLGKAERQLSDVGTKAADIQNLVRPAKALLEDTAFWRYQSDGLCIFLAPAFSRYFRLPSRFPEVMVVNKRLHLKPLIRFLTEEERFFLLRLAKDSATLFLGSKSGLDEVEVEGMPVRLSEVVPETERNSSLQTHTASGSSSGPGAGIFHGHFENDREKEESLRFFREVERKLKAFFRNEKAPLLLCGGDPVLSLYRSVNTYAQTLKTVLSGSFGKESLPELFERAIPLVRPVFREEFQSAVGSYKRLLGTGKTTKELEETLHAASSGRIESLFVPIGVQCWGRYDYETHKVAVEEKDTADNEDLLDRCAREGILNGATVFAVPKKEMPEDSNIAAVLRF